MVVELKGKSIRGVFALARNMGARVVGCLKWDASGVFRIKVILP